MNQLQNLLHDALISTNHVEKCALLDIEDSTVKASSVGFYPEQVDIESLVDAFDNTVLTRERGVFFEDVLYRCYRADNESIYAKEVVFFLLFFI
jgi:profilin